MIDWNKIDKAQSLADLKEAKEWLLQENTRLEDEKKRLKKENLLFEQKLSVLQDGFKKLDADRQVLEHEKKLFRKERLALAELENVSFQEQQVAEALFRNADNPLALQKRYRDLVKIFHPDNLFGDAELVQQINDEYSKRSHAL